MHRDRPGRQHEKPLHAKRKRKKDTYRFCKGIVGRPHNIGWREHPLWDGRIMSWDLVCINCNKVLDTVWARDIGELKDPIEIEWEKHDKRFKYLEKTNG